MQDLGKKRLLIIYIVCHAKSCTCLLFLFNVSVFVNIYDLITDNCKILQ